MQPKCPDDMLFGDTPRIGITFFGSGSRGNAALLHLSGSFYLVDAGLSCRKIETGLERCGISLDNLEGILVTHGHGDHIQGLGMVLKKKSLPVFATSGTFSEISDAGIIVKNPVLIDCKREFELGKTRVWPFPVPHDARDPIGLRFESGGHTLSLATDLGHISPRVLDYLIDTDILCLESNYDEEMLSNCRYPSWLKSRIRGPFGHLSNNGIRGVLSRFKRKLVSLVMVHISEEANTPALSMEKVSPLLSNNEFCTTRVHIAKQDAASPTFLSRE